MFLQEENAEIRFLSIVFLFQPNARHVSFTKIHLCRVTLYVRLSLLNASRIKASIGYSKSLFPKAVRGGGSSIPPARMASR